ncbi:hypothetical protein A2165_03100 [Candidatus Curtissbacteria bacterium RBG_13_40_7]|uniref:Uncharacterized protein n=1 Tax=Candidatus Curtissbacteria bacterium RBG_13_40_7 TaxID=1797706 RepID=A0A1F5FW22_9BACT|nr:MAG: hypothetical protein A2165_03100 [Candidatus Curtissbacteria bacterium RBG_13_40_7]
MGIFKEKEGLLVEDGGDGSLNENSGFRTDVNTIKRSLDEILDARGNSPIIDGGELTEEQLELLGNRLR